MYVLFRHFGTLRKEIGSGEPELEQKVTHRVQLVWNYWEVICKKYFYSYHKKYG